MPLLVERTLSAIAAGRVTHRDVGNAASRSATPMGGGGRGNVGSIFGNFGNYW